MGRTVCTEPQCLYKGALYLYHLKRFCLLDSDIVTNCGDGDSRPLRVADGTQQCDISNRLLLK